MKQLFFSNFHTIYIIAIWLVRHSSFDNRLTGLLTSNDACSYKYYLDGYVHIQIQTYICGNVGDYKFAPIYKYVCL